jgi:uncharacterized protein with von Willebrand factor type A (vWA) domain
MMPDASKSAGPWAVTAQLHGFVHVLRHNGLRVGLVEVTDAFQALSVLGDAALTTRESFRAALQCTLVKSQTDQECFARLFDLYFGSRMELDERLLQSLQEQLAEHFHGEGQTAALTQILQDMNGQLSQLTRAIVGAESAWLARQMQQVLSDLDLSGLQSRLQLSYFSQRLLSRLGMRQLEADLDALRAAFQERLGTPQAAHAMAALEGRAASLRRIARDAIEAELEMRSGPAEERAGSLLDKSFARLSPQEVQRMREVVRALAERLKSVVRRRRVERRGLLDVRKTLRFNMAFGGVPLRVRFRRRTKDRPQLAILCDVSDSVRHASMFMLQLVYTLQELFARVRSFVFVSDLGEVTELFKLHSVEDAVDLSLANRVINVHANSNFGRAFVMFHRQHMDAVTRNTTVIVLGDGRNNYNPHQAWVLQELRLRAKRVLWLCTEDRGTWGFGDSEMPTYARACDQVEVVQNLRQLRKAVDAILT